MPPPPPLPAPPVRPAPHPPAYVREGNEGDEVHENDDEWHENDDEGYGSETDFAVDPSDAGAGDTYAAADPGEAKGTDDPRPPMLQPYRAPSQCQERSATVLIAGTVLLVILVALVVLALTFAATSIDAGETHFGTLKTLNRTVGRLETQVDGAALRVDVEDLRETVAALRTDLGTLRVTVAALRTNLGTLRTDLGSLRTDLGSLYRAALGQVGAVNRSAAGALAAAEARIQAANASWVAAQGAARLAEARHQLRLFRGDRPCPPGWTEPPELRGFLLVARPVGGRAGTRLNRPLGAREVGRVGPHGHAAVVRDPGHRHDLGVFAAGNNRGAPQAEVNADEGPLQSGVARTGIRVDVQNHTGDHYPLAHVLVCAFRG